ncbi:MAG: hypothetical protein K6G72_12315 [Lachnospiraceae bacterium]|nr:hypothetical protein [Lachnospiraceae bacterium]
MKSTDKIYYHLPGLFEFYELYKIFLPLFYEHKEFFYDWCEIGSVYGAPGDALWGGGRVGFGDADSNDVAALMREYNISSRLTFSNSLLTTKHLSDKKCNDLCALFEHNSRVENGIIIYSDLLLDYIKLHYPGFYFVSSTTKVLRNFKDFEAELNKDEYRFVVPDFRLNKEYERLNLLSDMQKNKVEFLCNECCSFECRDRKACYENVSLKSLSEDCYDHVCVSPDAKGGYRFSKAMENPGFISPEAILKYYKQAGFSHFKIEGRSLGSAVVFEMLLYYMVKSEFRLRVREEIYLDSSLDLF